MDELPEEMEDDDSIMQPDSDGEEVQKERFTERELQQRQLVVGLRGPI